MPRSIFETEPIIINLVRGRSTESKILHIATRNEHKLKEIQRLLPEYEIIGKDLKVEEIQTLDPFEVVRQKAIKAWEKNDYNPILVEDVSLEILGLGGRPGPYINDFCSEVEIRRMIAEIWLKNRDRRAIARVLLAIYDGFEVHIYEGKVSGKIADTLKGTNGFGWDDMFIPTSEFNPDHLTFAEMKDELKDKMSMRRMALNKMQLHPLQLNHPVLMIEEPYQSELERMRLSKLNDDYARRFAFSLECLEKGNEANSAFTASNYQPIIKTENKFYLRFITDPGSYSLGLLLTDIDRASLKLYKNGDPFIWQMGPERRQLALAQRAEFFLENQNPRVHEALNRIEDYGIPDRSNNRSVTIEKALGTTIIGDVTETKALKEIGYKKISSDKYVSRSAISSLGLFNKIGKYARSIYGIGSMPPISGWRDVLVTGAIGHMPIFTHRNSLNAVNFERQIKLIASAKKVLRDLGLSNEAYTRAERNIGAAIGTNNLKQELHKVHRLYNEANVKLFRIYTINGDPRVVELAAALRQAYGKEIEIFAGQIADKKQALQLISSGVNVDALVFGHGGGSRCTSATNGMALTTLEEIYDITTDPHFNSTTIVAEGGVGKSVGSLLVMGVDLILSNQKLVKGTIELSDIFFQHKNGKLCHPYHGSASAATMLIESSNPELLESRMYYSGRAKKIEGSPGYMYFSKKAGSMAFYVNEFRHYAARTLADLGVSDFFELRDFLRKNKTELLRIISTEAAFTGGTHSES